jgi:hypothetical protein
MNAFLDIADAQMASPVKAKHRAAEKRAILMTPEERDQRNAQILFRKWQKWHKEKVQALLDGPYGKDVQGIKLFLDTMTLSSSGALVRLVNASAWMRKAPADVRHEVLAMIDASIIRLREKNGMPPFDDALPHEPPTAFQEIREVLR